MKLQLKLVLIVVPIILASSAATGYFATRQLSAAGSEYLGLYMSQSIDTYIAEYPRRLHRLLERNGLGNVDSYIAKYQEAAIAGAESQPLPAGFRLWVIDASGKLLSNQADARQTGTDHLPQSIGQEGTAPEENERPKPRFDAASGGYYTVGSFVPWNWTIVMTSSDSQLGVAKRSTSLAILLFSGAVGVFAAAVIFVSLKRLYVTPILKVESAAEAIARGSEVQEIAIHAKDELGHLARSVENASQAVAVSRKLLADHNRLLEEAVAHRTKALEDINRALVQEVEHRKQAEIAAQESLEQKQVLLREVHHRVKNNLSTLYSLVGLQQNLTDDKALNDAYRSLQGRIESMALLHRLLYRSDDLGVVRFADYCGQLIESITQTYRATVDRVAVHIDILDVPLDIDTAIPCGMIVNELVTNALEHAFPGSRHGNVAVEFGRESDGYYRLSVADDGVGVRKETEGSGLGAVLVTSLSDQIGGSVDVRTELEAGTVVQIRFPRRENK